MRHTFAGLLLAAALIAPAVAQAQYYYAQPPGPPPSGYSRVIVTDAPPPGSSDPRAYPYVGNGRPAFPAYAPQPAYVPPQADYAPQPYLRNERHARHKRAAHAPVVTPAKKERQAELIQELKKRPRIKSVTVSGVTGTVAPPEEAAARGKPVLGKDGARVIRAEAEVRIIGDDQMSIRLYRRGTSPNAKAE